MPQRTVVHLAASERLMALAAFVECEANFQPLASRDILCLLARARLSSGKPLPFYSIKLASTT
ncbi:MAG: hypothetical protein DMF68_01175 [Acidobacteria bacterium]|nr:MAG: hypothetical protein DMF68_01175 [Acidobacteriota bacterium]